jgi:DNA-binding Lrp family transcriptional regulator
VFLKVRARDPEDLARLLREEIGSVPSVIHTRSTIALFTEKEHGSLPVLEQERDEPVEKPRMRAG